MNFYVIAVPEANKTVVGRIRDCIFIQAIEGIARSEAFNDELQELVLNTDNRASGCALFNSKQEVIVPRE